MVGTYCNAYIIVIKDGHTSMNPNRLAFYEFAKLGLSALIIATLIRIFIAEPFIVSGPSMMPAYNAGDYLIIDRISYRYEKPVRGETIVFQYPLDPSIYYIKRIAGLPGETIDGTVLAPDEYFMLGDNAHASSDSREWGPLQKKFIIGRVFMRAWPMTIHR